MSEKTDLSNIAKLELESIDPFQYGLHFSTPYIKHIQGVPISQDETYPASDHPESNFRLGFKKTAWSVIEKERMLSKSRENGIIEFIFNNKMDFALRCYVIRVLPRVNINKKFKGKVEISWSSDLGHHAYETIQLYIGGILIQTIYPIAQDIYYRYDMQESKKAVYKKMVDMPQVWNSHVGEICLKTPLMFSFEKHITQAIPLFTLPESIQVRVVVKYKTKIQDLIKMRVKDEEGDGFKEVEFDMRFMEETFTSKDSDKVPIPEMYADYSKITEEEKNFFETVIFKKQNDGSFPDKTAAMSYYYEDIIKMPTKIQKPGSKVDIDLSSRLPVKCIYWVAQSKVSLIYHNYSNYSTNPLDKIKGKHPIAKVGFSYNGTDNKIEQMTSCHFDEITSFYRGSSGGPEIGYGCLPLCHSPTDFKLAQIGLTFSKNNPKLHLYLDDVDDTPPDDIDKDLDDDTLLKSVRDGKGKKSIDASMNYEVHVFLLVTKRVDFLYKGGIVVYDGFNEIKYY
jgi:hypothetical protein